MGVAIALTRTGHILRARERKRSEEDGMTNAIVTSKLSNFEKPTTKRDVDKLPKRRWHCCNPCHPQKIVRFLLEDWLFLAVLGVLMAFLSLAVDACIDQLQTFHMYLMNKVERADDDLLNFALTYIVWMAYTMVVMLASVVFVHYVGPQAIGSGIPEMKTILRGVRLKECLSFRTLMAKMVGLALAIGSGFPIGKEGPFVHVGSIVANLISRLVRNFKPAYANESRSCEMLAAGCAAGVACTFSAPIGGVLFSIEVTAVYFAVRDYWRGFFAAACGSAIFSLLRLYTHSSEVTVVAFYQTTFKNRAFYPEELFIFALIGLFCGITGAIFICIHRQLVLFLRRNSFMKIIFQRNWIVYPIVISAIYATLTHPIGFGRYITGEVVFSHTLKDFFMNCTWSAHPSKFETCAGSVAARWSADESIFAELVVFVVGFYFLSIVASTLPVPAGIFMPVFVIGAGMGRLFGEIVAHNFPDGLRGDRQMLVYPGIYAVVGASSFCGAVTHTVSVAVIAFELTGQLLHILPVMSVRKLCLQPIFMLQIAVIIANITCSSFQPSFFDSIIKIKHLPYLPDIPKSTSEVHSIRAEQIMITNVKFLSKKSTYRELQDLLISLPRLRAFPIVDDPETKILLGSVSRATLLQLLDAQVGEAARRAEAAKRINEERELLASLQPSREEIKLKKPMFSIGTPDAARKTAVENFVATHAESAAVDRFRVLPVHSHDRCESRKTKGIGTTSRPQLDRSISETNTRKLATTTTAPSESQLKTASSAGDMLVGTKQLSPHHRKLLTVHSAHDFYVTLGGMLRNFTHTFRHSKKRRINSDLMAHELLDAQVGEAARRAEAAKRINEERELLASLQPSREEIKLKKPMFSIGTPDAARKTAVENFVATHAESAAVDRFRVLPVHSHDRCESRKTKGIGTTSRPQLDRSISETNTRKLATTTTAPSESQLKTASSAGDMLVGTKQLSPHHRKLLTVHSAHDFYVTLGGMLRNFTHTFRHSKKRRINSDLMAHERHEWERKQLACIVDFGSAIIDPAPFQLVEDTSLYKVHSIFSLLGIRRAYVTKCGVLVGVVALRDLRSAIERTQWGELDSKTERVEEVMELPVVSSKRRASSHSEGHQTDLDSDTDDEDCILPRVEVEETTPSTCELEQRLPMAVTSSDISDQYVAGDADLSAGPLTPTSSTEENGAAACHLPLKLESYLEAYGGKSSGQQPSAPIPMHTAGSAKLPGCARHVLIVEPEHSTQMVKTNTERNSDGKGIAGATSCHRQPCRKYECGSRSKIVPKHFKSHQEKSVSSIGNSNDGDVRQSSMAEKCSMWIDDDDDVLSDSPVRSGKVFDEESTSAISSSLCGERQSSTTSGSNIATGRLGMDPDPLIACHPTQRSISDVVRPRLISEERVWSRRSPVNAEPQTPLSSTAKSPKQNGHELTTDDDL
ncbi:Chloride channel protein 2 [Toxocara canis]|uniref:Chloride channel protein n=1 Tax=Toxocara canis TaxID=6265 RepID=A0A0B2W3I0_TOXCA|nr:Chloride channel protein 2 [Toxocara canis]